MYIDLHATCVMSRQRARAHLAAYNGWPTTQSLALEFAFKAVQRFSDCVDTVANALAEYLMPLSGSMLFRNEQSVSVCRFRECVRRAFDVTSCAMFGKARRYVSFAALKAVSLK